MKYDTERKTLVEPYLPNHEIGIVHFAGKNNDQIRNDKNFISKIETNLPKRLTCYLLDTLATLFIKQKLTQIF